MGHNVMDIPSIEAIIQHVTTPVGRKMMVSKMLSF